MTTVGKRIKRRRKQLGISADKLAEMINKNRATIYRYESDEIENMPYDVVLPISEALNVSPAYIMGWQDRSNKGLTTKYDFYSCSVAAGIPTSIDAIQENDIEKIEIPDALLGKWAGSKDIFFTKVNGDSMNKVIPDKSIVAVKKVELEELKDNDIVLFSNDNEYSIKRFFNNKEKNIIVFRPDSYNNSFLDQIINIDCSDNLEIHGKIVTYIVSLD